MNSQNKSLEQIIDFRIKKLKEIIECNIDPYPSIYNKTHSIENVLDGKKELLNKDISISGRVVSIRKMGKVTFINLHEDGFKIQLFIKKDNLKDSLYDDLVKRIDLGDIVGTHGALFYTKTNELSIKSNDFTLLSKSIRPLPNLKEKDGKVFFSFDDKELRYRKRHLDLIANQNIKNLFIKRSVIINEIRNYLNENKYIEVETPVLQPIYGGANAKPFKTYHNSLGQDFYLRIADELYLKRLIIGGFNKVYEIAKNFRNEGIDKNHNPEFTMLEFYSTYEDVNSMMTFTESMINTIFTKISSDNYILFKNNKINLKNQFEKYDFYEILNNKTNLEINKLENNDLYKILIKNKINIDKKSSRARLLDKIFSFFVEPSLIQPTFIINYPLELSPLAKMSKTNNDLVERFELFIGGMEIANAFTELNDPIDQRLRLEKQNNSRKHGDDEAQIIDEDFIQSMEYGMPPTGGVGLGIDRLVMIFTSQNSIKDVILFPTLKTEE